MLCGRMLISHAMSKSGPLEMLPLSHWEPNCVIFKHVALPVSSLEKVVLAFDEVAAFQIFRVLWSGKCGLQMPRVCKDLTLLLTLN